MRLFYLAVMTFFPMGYSYIPGEKSEVPKCGTTTSGTLSDCRTMLRDLGNTIHPAWERDCSYNAVRHTLVGPPGRKFGVAYNPFCSPGECCFYTDRPHATIERMRKYGEMLLGCGNEHKNLVNGRVLDEDMYQYCLSDGQGCGDCFED